jgi:molecular chaperone IbpA
LTIEGKIDSKEEKEFVHKGLASRSFKRTFTLAEEIIVEGAKLEDGILSVSLKRVIPEEKKPVSIEIS